MKPMAIVIHVGTQYGCPVFLPANEAARTLAKIAGTKTLTVPTIEGAKALGHKVEIMPDPKIMRAAETLAARVGV